MHWESLWSLAVPSVAAGPGWVPTDVCWPRDLPADRDLHPGESQRGNQKKQALAPGHSSAVDVPGAASCQ